MLDIEVEPAVIAMPRQCCEDEDLSCSRAEQSRELSDVINHSRIHRAAALLEELGERRSLRRGDLGWPCSDWQLSWRQTVESGYQYRCRISRS